MIILGGILIIVAALNLVNFNPYSINENVYITPAIDQAGFAPLFIPREVSLIAGIAQQIISPNIPDRLIIDKISLDAPIELAKSIEVTIDGEEVTQFLVPEEFAAGWDEGSAPLGVPGNTVLSGHNNAFGEVFKRLVNLKVGDTFTLLSGVKPFNYIIAKRMILPEKNEPIDVRLENSRWIMPSTDERVTLITCWPAPSNTHRLIIVAVPLTGQEQKGNIEPTLAPTQPIRLTTPIIKLLSSTTATP